MPSKKRYEHMKAIKAFDAIVASGPQRRIILVQIGNSLDVDEECFKYEPGRGGYWGANNHGKGARIANQQKHNDTVVKAKNLLKPYEGELGKRGIIKKIAIENNKPETTVRRYIKYFKENPPRQ
jgi:hypothetical protein